MVAPRENALAGRRVLLFEAEHMVARNLARALRGWGADVVGPVSTLSDALTLIEAGGRLDGAVLDVSLPGQAVYPAVDALRRRGVPVVLVTGYGAAVVPERYAAVPRCENPVAPADIVRALLVS